MGSLYEELEAKLQADPSLLRRSGPRQDLGLLLFSNRGEIDRLWKAAERTLVWAERPDERGLDALEELRAAVEGLRMVFGDRGKPY
jgi:hypothetical protein